MTKMSDFTQVREITSCIGPTLHDIDCFADRWLDLRYVKGQGILIRYIPIVVVLG